MLSAKQTKSTRGGLFGLDCLGSIWYSIRQYRDRLDLMTRHCCACFRPWIFMCLRLPPPAQHYHDPIAKPVFGYGIDRNSAPFFVVMKQHGYYIYSQSYFESHIWCLSILNGLGQPELACYQLGIQSSNLVILCECPQGNTQ